MNLYMNEHKEFLPPDVFDPDLNRAKAYKGCIEVDMDRIRKNASMEERMPDVESPGLAECPYCHRRFRKGTPCQQYCSEKCRRGSYNAARRAEHAARKGKPDVVECPWCRERFEKRRPYQKYCSEECQRADYSRRRKEGR